MITTRMLRTGKKFCRSFSSVPSWEEIQIPVPWGHIAGKWWGPKDKRPILALHGWLDNCGSFDRLIPLLNPQCSFLAIDFPGHGLSSHIPAGLSYSWMDCLIVVRRIVRYFNWPKVSLLGHSFGAGIASHYEMTYPGQTDFLICVDSIRPVIEDDVMRLKCDKIDNIIKYEQSTAANNEAPVYEMQDLIKALHEKSAKSIGLDVGKYILERNVKESSITPNKYYLLRDRRLRDIPMMYYSRDEILTNTSRLICPILYFRSNTVTATWYEMLANTREFTDILEKVNKHFEMYVVKGTHHVHLNNPELIKDYINNFIKKYDM